LTQIWQSLYPLLYPMLDTDYQNPSPGQSPPEYLQPPLLQPVDPTNPYWTYQFVGGQPALLNEQPPFQWMPVLRTLAPNDTVVPGDERGFFMDRAELGNSDLTGVSGTAVLNGPVRDDTYPYIPGTGNRDFLVSDHDVPFSHPLGYDVEFFVVPDTPYLSLLGPTNIRVYDPLKLTGEYPAAIEKALAPYPTGLGLSDAAVNGLLGIEIDSACLPEAYRPHDGDRVAVFGRWIVDAGHEDFHTEIHPPMVLAGARRQAVDATHSWVIARPYRVSQRFLDSDGNRTQGIRGALESQVTAQVTSFVIAPLGSKPTPQQLDLTPEIQGGIMPSVSYTGSARGIPPQKEHITTTLSFVVRPPTPRASPSDQLLVTWHFTVRSGVDVYVLNTGLDEVEVVLDVGRSDFAPAKVPTDGESITVYVKDLQNPELEKVLAQKRQDIASAHGDDVGDFFWQLINLGARSTKFDSPTWPKPKSVTADAVNIVFELSVEALPSAETFMPGQTQPAAVGVDDAQAFPIYGFVDVQWRRAGP
jgi:hypothetical protein